MNIKYQNRLGEKWMTNSGYFSTIYSYENSLSCSIIFEDGTIVDNIKYDVVKSGKVINPNFPILYGVGYKGQGKYKQNEHNKPTKIYKTWCGMLERGYSKKLKEKQPTYKDVVVCEQWHNFQNFAKWFVENYDQEIMNGWHLDKDIISTDSKIYSPETCAFVPREINNLFLLMYKNNEGLTGIKKNKNKYQARISKNGNKRISLGYFNTKEEAFTAYKLEKESWVKEIAELWKSKIDSRVYSALHNYKVKTH